MVIGWYPSAGATKYDIYFGTAGSPPLVASDQLTSALGSITNPGTLEYNVGTLANGTQYYWKIVAKNDTQSTTGDIWTFFTQPVTPPPPPSDPPDPVKGTALLTLVAAGSNIFRDTGLIQGNSDYTCTFWFKPTIDVPGPEGRAIFTLKNTAFDAYVQIFQNTTDFVLNVVNGLGTDVSQNAVAYTNQFNCVAYVHSGNNHLFYVNQVLVGTIVCDMSGVTFDKAIIGFDGFSVNNFELSYFREWSSALTLTQLGHEWGSRSAIVTANLNCDTPLTDDLYDQSGLDNIWTATGVYSFTDKLVIIDPPVANLDSTTAYELELNTQYIQDLRSGSLTLEPWFKYTSPVDQYLSTWGWGGIPNLGYRPTLDTYDSTVSIYPPDRTAPQNVPYQFPVFAGEIYYHKLFKNGNNDPSLLRINIVPHIPVTVPNGAIFVPDDTNRFGGSFISSVDGEDYNIYKFLFPFPAGEYGDIIATLESPQYLFEDKETEELVRYDVNFVELQRIAFSNGAGSENIVRANQISKKWYALNRRLNTGNATYTSLDTNGIQGAEVIITTGGGTAMAPNNEDTILYISGHGALANSNIKQWNLISQSFIADLVATVSGYQNRDMLVMSDGSLLALYFKDTSTRDLKAIRYDASGNILNTYNIHNGNDLISTGGSSPVVRVGYRLAYAIADPNTFWVWLHLDDPVIGQVCIFRNINVSDGATIAEKQEVSVEAGAHLIDQTFELANRFGVSISCPFVIIRTVGGPIIPPSQLFGGIYKITPGKRFDTLWDDISAGTTEDVEIPNPNWSTGALGE